MIKVAENTPAPRQLFRLSWSVMQIIILLMAGTSAVFAGLCWLTGAIDSLDHLQVAALLTIIIVLNLVPPVIEFVFRRLDLFDAKNLFLAYFFVVFGVHSFCEIALGMAGDPLLNLPDKDSSLRIHSLSAIVLCLASFLIGCYIPLGHVIACLLPRIPKTFVLSERRVKFFAFGGVLLGVFAFNFLMDSAGGISSFFNNLGSWRTLGVLAGVGFLTFPITAVMPAAVLLLLLNRLPLHRRRLKWFAVWFLPLLFLTIFQILILGFRIVLVPVLLQFIAVWHYMQRPISALQVIVLAAGLFLFLALFGMVRSASEGNALEMRAGLQGLVFRIPGNDLVEKIILCIEQGEPHRGILPLMTASATILVPRSLWPGKPLSEGLTLADVFFYDYFVSRGDPIDGIKSGISPTLVGHALWIGGILAVIVISFILGLVARVAVEWRRRGHGHRLHVLVYVIFMSTFAVWVEAPEGALNTSVMMGGLALFLVFFLSVGRAQGRTQE